MRCGVASCPKKNAKNVQPPAKRTTILSPDTTARVPYPTELAMPEQLTKYPEVTLQVLRSAGAKCAEGAPQAILTACPKERFCKLPGGELCVYGLNDATKMTQITATEWRGILSSLSHETALPPKPFMADGLLIGGVGLLLGVAIGLAMARIRRRRR